VGRFEREAQALAALNHPHIAGIYGLEQAGSQHFLAMELVEGESLAERLTGGALAVDEALPIARQIGEALAAAHEKGIIHRDLKPANVMLTRDGRVKVLDFGLAKIVEPQSAAAGTASMSPTLSLHATMAGTILGTAAYMSPEQARGRSVDKRTDIWAFGCVLFEMLTARRAFEGDDTAETIAAVVRGEPDWTLLPGDVPASIVATIRRCLIKDPSQRFADVSIPLFLLQETPATVAHAAAPARPTPTGIGRAMPWAVAATALAALAGVLALWQPWRSVATTPMTFAIVAPPKYPVGLSVTDRPIAIAPDGSAIAYAAGSNATNQLMIRDLGALEPRLVTDLTGIRSPFFSPDSKWIAFFRGNELMKVAVSGGPAVALARVDSTTRGGTWNSDGTIVFATNDRKTGLLVVADSGGTPNPLTDLPNDATDHLLPAALPGGRGVLYSIQVNNVSAGIAVRDATTGRSKVLLQAGDQAQYVESGHLIYASGGTLYGVAFDLGKLEVTGTPTPLVSNVWTAGTGATNFGVSSNGTLIHVPGRSQSTAQRSVVWVDRTGVETPLPLPPRAYFALRLSPDGNRIALDIRDQDLDIWVWDLARRTPTRLSSRPGIDSFPVWTPDGGSIAYGGGGGGRLVIRSADGVGAERQLSSNDQVHFAQAFTPDGKQLLTTLQRATNDLVLLPADGSMAATTIIETAGVDGPADISPDGKWLAYQSDESGQNQIYVRPFPNVGDGRWQISPGGGTKPVWSRNRDQRELFYLDASGALTRVPIAPGPPFSAGIPVRLTSTSYFSANQARSYDVTPDGRRFLFIKDGPNVQDPAATPAHIVVTLNWLEEVKSKLAN
jgi:serine/threonine-protein kinase